MKYETAFAKIVTDLHGRNHILIDGRLVTLDGPTEANNEMVGVIVDGLRRGQPLTGVPQAASLSSMLIGSSALPGDQDHD